VRVIPQTILFDMDDTLVHCNKYFDMVIDQFVDEMLTWFRGFGLTAEQIKDKQTEIDLIGVNRYGLIPERFPQSFVETYRHYADLFGRPASGAEEEFAYRLGTTVYEQTAEPYPYMEETLQTLAAAGHTLYLYTGGDETIQRKKMKAAGLDRFFGDRVFVTLHKNVEYMKSIVASHGFDPSVTWMIGNSVRTDVIPALEAGLNCIHIPAPNDWHFNLGEVTAVPQGEFLRLPSLRDVPPAIAAYASKRKP
jgi:putative hydrolase of the HAD superfamily